MTPSKKFKEMRPREFWIYEKTETYSGFEQENQTEFGNSIHVREVNPELDAAVEKMVEALEWIIKNGYDIKQDREALAAYRKAMK